MISYGRQSISQKDVEKVVEILQSDFLTQGPAVEHFEKKVAAYCGAKYAVAVNSATSALHIACMAADLQEGDILWTVPNTFVASANCALYCNAQVDFVDIDSKTYNMDAELLEKKLLASEIKPKIVVPVHFAGQACDMDKIRTLAKKFGFTVIEDASHAIGATFKETKVGSCAYSDMTVFSFHPVKIITTGEGGMVLTNNEKLYQKLLLHRSHGITRQPDLMYGEPHGSWYYEQINLGYNYRMTDIQAALGSSQIEELDTFLTRRRTLAARYNKLLTGLPLQIPYQNNYTNSSWHIYVVRMDLKKIKLSKRVVFEKMREKGINLNVHYIPVHLQPYYQNLGFKAGQFQCSEEYYKEAFTLPIYYGLTDEQQDYIVLSLQEVLS